MCTVCSVRISDVTYWITELRRSESVDVWIERLRQALTQRDTDINWLQWSAWLIYLPAVIAFMLVIGSRSHINQAVGLILCALLVLAIGLMILHLSARQTYRNSDCDHEVGSCIELVRSMTVGNCLCA
jgi:hypothetical protein